MDTAWSARSQTRGAASILDSLDSDLKLLNSLDFYFYGAMYDVGHNAASKRQSKDPAAPRAGVLSV